MPCLHPVKLNPHVVPCGQCEGCLTSRRNDWSFRLQQELRDSKNAKFITLTYAEGNEPWTENEVLTLSKRDCQLFMKRLRKHAEPARKKLNWPKIRYFLVGEYGTITERPHYHALIFNIPETTVDNLDNIWGLGFTYTGSCTNASIHYTTKYIINAKPIENGRERQFSLMSRRPGIGHGYFKRTHQWHQQNNHYHAIGAHGQKVKLPRYYQNKMFGKFSREIRNHKALQEYITNDREKFNEAMTKGHNYWQLQANQIDQFKRRVNQGSKSKKV